MYQKHVKRLLDGIISLGGILVFSWLFILIGIALVIDDPGPILFRQKRIGMGKKCFFILKFRSMKTSTPHDIPTHLLTDPDQFITRVGRFLRKTSLDELPQFFNILFGDMAIVGPRPALWNQTDLIKARDRCGANDVRPGLTGWAQINGRDELEIQEKVLLDKEYVEILQGRGWRAFMFDVKCFFGTIARVLNHDGVVEGGMGEIHKKPVSASAGTKDS